MLDFAFCCVTLNSLLCIPPGCVYCCGVGYGEHCLTWDRLQVRKNLTVIQALAGIGVTTVTVVRALVAMSVDARTRCKDADNMSCL